MTEPIALSGSTPLRADDFFGRVRERFSLETPAALTDPNILPRRGDHDVDPVMRAIAAVRPIKPAAVLVPIIAREQPMVLFTQRTAHLKDHAGQISFPGGKIDATDASPAAAAVREAFEEVGLEPHLIEPVGYLDLYMTTLGYRIVPTIARVAPAFHLKLNRHEVDDAFEVPLAFLMTPDNHKLHSRDWNGLTRTFYAMPYGERYIWGATADFAEFVRTSLWGPMIRPVFTELALFLIPFALYGVFLVATRQGLIDPASWPWSRVVWLFIAALLIVLGGFVAFAQFGGAPPNSTYTPARFEKWQIDTRVRQVTMHQVTMRRLDAPWLREGPLARVLALLDRDGEEARVVGGAVRNALLGEPSGDNDIATTALPQEVARRAEAAGFKAVPTGIDHGTVTIVVDGEPFEVTTLRQDVETFGRHAKVAFGRDWAHDAKRRDFTMNALYVGRDGVVHDHVGGLADLDRRRVRFIGNPHERIAEDYLRILRFFRFHASYGHGGPPDPEGLHACIVERSGLDTLSRERLRMELLKLLPARNVVSALEVMSECGLIGRVLGGVPYVASVCRMIELERALALAPDAVRRLGALGVHVTEDAERLRDRLRLANAEFARLAGMADGWWRLSARTGESDARVLLYRLGPQRFNDRALLAWSRSPDGIDDERWRTLVTLPARWSVPRFPLRAAHFLARGLKGPALGAALRAAEEAWIAQGFPLDEAALARIIDEVLETGAHAQLL